mmetsp:Transcript_2055/g.6634  ORF Transcript_2055/g.6634 Transcript_2055/m.6634 type:complete len:425 (+) Transcript_2055:925-2199(+)
MRRPHTLMRRLGARPRRAASAAPASPPASLQRVLLPWAAAGRLSLRHWHHHRVSACRGSVCGRTRRCGALTARGSVPAMAVATTAPATLLTPSTPHAGCRLRRRATRSPEGPAAAITAGTGARPRRRARWSGRAAGDGSRSGDARDACECECMCACAMGRSSRPCAAGDAIVNRCTVLCLWPRTRAHSRPPATRRRRRRRLRVAHRRRGRRRRPPLRQRHLPVPAARLAAAALALRAAEAVRYGDEERGAEDGDDRDGPLGHVRLEERVARLEHGHAVAARPRKARRALPAVLARVARALPAAAGARGGDALAAPLAAARRIRARRHRAHLERDRAVVGAARRVAAGRRARLAELANVVAAHAGRGRAVDADDGARAAGRRLVHARDEDAGVGTVAAGRRRNAERHPQLRGLPVHRRHAHDVDP